MRRLKRKEEFKKDYFSDFNEAPKKCRFISAMLSREIPFGQ